MTDKIKIASIMASSKTLKRFVLVQASMRGKVADEMRDMGFPMERIEYEGEFDVHMSGSHRQLVAYCFTIDNSNVDTADMTELTFDLDMLPEFTDVVGLATKRARRT